MGSHTDNSLTPGAIPIFGWDTIELSRRPAPPCILNSRGSPSIPPCKESVRSMARIYPFRAWRYNPSVVRIDDVVTQPYDKISPAMQQAYYDRSPYNLVRVILGKAEEGDSPAGPNVYSRAAETLKKWQQEQVLLQEETPVVFAYAQRFTVPGSSVIKERRGFIALGKVHDYAEKIVFRHEQTLSKPKGDRLNLLKATHAHFGQIFMLYSDPISAIEKLIFDDAKPADVAVTDEYDVLHRIWKISDPAVIKQLAAAMDEKKLIIADGHHRYETALNYSKEHAPASKPAADPNALPQPDYPEEAVMMTFVNMDSDGLVVLPTHRVVHSLEGFDGAGFAAKAAEFFDVTKLEKGDAVSYMKLLGEQKTQAFVAVTAKGDFLLSSKAESITPLLAALPEHQRQLDLSHLHTVILDRLLGLDAEKVREQTNIRYLRSAEKAVEQARTGEADITFLTNPVTMEQLKDVAFAGEVMPQKSTDFFPKLLTGIAIYALD